LQANTSFVILSLAVTHLPYDPALPKVAPNSYFDAVHVTLT
jgi:hypothetical protein